MAGGSGLTGGGTPIVTGGNTTGSGAPGTGSAGVAPPAGTPVGQSYGSTQGLAALGPPLRPLSPLPFGQLSDGVILGDGARYGLTEAWDLVNPATVERTWSGKAIVNGAPYTKKHKISWSASGKAIVEQPAWAGIQPGDAVNLWCLTPQTAYIDSGLASVQLPWTPVADAPIVASLQSTGQRIPVALLGSVVTLLRDPGGDIVTVRYRPIVPVLVLKWGASTAHLDATVPWRAEFEEQ